MLNIVFGVLARIIVAWFSRQREFRADRGAAHILGTPRPMIAALQRLAEKHGGFRNCRRHHDGAVFQPSANRGSDRGLAAANLIAAPGSKRKP
jgi:Zn-dependent protease with chaperone function